jgi:dinuclear metal center YbgI/SA1388 family protein
VGLAVDASLQTYRSAVDAGCQMLIVHHGLIWNGIRAVTDATYRHLKFLLDHDLNIYASHLPLDKHPVVGNNVQLARIVGIATPVPAFTYHGTVIGCRGALRSGRSLRDISSKLTSAISSEPVILPFGPQKSRTIGIVSGGAPDMLQQAIEAGLDCFITGESAHFTHHQAAEAGINVIFAGHYQTETVGVKALGAMVAKKFGVETVFLDIPTRV